VISNQPRAIYSLDDPKQTFSVGYNYRYANYYHQLDPDSNTQIEYRDLYKVYGIRIVFISNGEGRRFDIVPLLVNIGSGLGLLAFATLISDFVILYFVPQRDRYKAAKFEDVAQTGSIRNYGDSHHGAHNQNDRRVDDAGAASSQRSTEYTPLQV
jgi:P2X purinoceptor 4